MEPTHASYPSTARRGAALSAHGSRGPLILLAVLSVSAAHFLMSRHGHTWHTVHVAFGALGLLPIVAAALWLPTRWAVATASLSAGLYLLHARTSWAGHPYENVNQVATAAIYVFVVVVTAALVAARDRERQRAAAAMLDSQRDAALQALASLSSALRHRDDGTGAHCRRVASLSAAMARAMNLPRPRVEAIERAALVHDVGKIGLRDDVLLKPGELTAEERAQVEHHPSIAADILRPIRGAEEIAQIVLAHHENLDATGYPRALRADEISLEARILRVADVFDALRGRRSYKEPLAVSASLALIDDLVNQGKLDPTVVAALRRTLETRRLDEIEAAVGRGAHQ